MSPRTSIILKLAASAAVSLLLVVLLLRMTGAGADGAANLAEVLRATALGGLGLYVVLHLAGAAVRAARFRLLLAAGAAVPAPRFGRVMLISLVRNMMVDMLPARIGELSYIALMNRGCQVPGDRCVSSLSISFIFDMIALVVLVLGLVLFESATGSSGLPLPLLCGVLAVPVAGATALLFVGIRPATRLVRTLAGRWRDAPLLLRITTFLEKVADAIHAAARAGVLWRVLGLSLLVRLAKYGGMFGLFRAVTEASFPDLHGASFLQVMLALIGGEAGASLALPTLMGFGAYEAGSMAALAWSGFPAAAVAVTMLAVHIWSQCVDYLFGGLAFSIFMFTTPGTPRPAWSPRMRRRVMLAAALLAIALAAAGAWAWHLRSLRKAGAKAPPPPGEAIAPTPSANRAIHELLNGRRAFIVWCSNRDGNHDLYRLDLPDGEPVPLTRHPHVDTFPRIAPDGTRVVFARSQDVWVSQRNPVPWDIYMLDLADGRERLVARNGYVPTWTADGGGVIFQREGTTVVEHRLDNGEERVLFTAAGAGLPEQAQLQTPSLSADGRRLAATVRNNRRPGTLLLENGADTRPVGGGCQLTWGPDDRYLYQVDKGGNQQNAFYRVDTATLERTLWFDAPGTHSHEYFPRVSRDDSVMVYGASTGGHEHDQADYEIFLWRLGDPPEQAARLTFHTGNDCWPDVFVNPATR